MKRGKLFSSLVLQFPEFETLSSNKFSGLTNAELSQIIKKLRSKDKESWTTFKNYILWSRELKARNVYIYMRDSESK